MTTSDQSLSSAEGSGERQRSSSTSSGDGRNLILEVRVTTSVPSKSNQKRLFGLINGFKRLAQESGFSLVQEESITQSLELISRMDHSLNVMVPITTMRIEG